MIGYLRGAIGIIHSINTDDYTAKVKLPEYNDQITEDLVVLTPLSQQNKQVAIPKVNTPVFCIFTSEGAEHGFIVGAFFSDNNPSESKDGEYKINFRNSILTLDEGGNVQIDAKITKINSEVIISENVSILKSLNVSNGVSVGDGVNIREGSISAKGDVRANGTITAPTIREE